MLPARSAKNTPEFDGRALSLNRYWEDIEELADSLERNTNEEKIKIAQRYLEREEELLWKGCFNATDDPPTWEEYKIKIAALYPGSNGERLFSTSDLDSFISEHVHKKIRTKDDLSAYHRKFRTMTTHLIAEGRMSTMEAQKEFPKGLDETFRNRIYRRLEITEPDHLSGIPYAMESVVRAGHHVLDGPSSIVDDSFVRRKWWTWPARSQRCMKAIKWICNPLRRQLTTESLQGRIRHPTPCTRSPNNYGPRQAWATPLGGSMFQPGKCRFCSGQGHFVRECTVAAEFIRTGKCFRNNANKIVLPNGQFIPRDVPGRNFAEKIERWLAENPPRGVPPRQPPPPAQNAPPQNFE
ncbi:hypothetical protein C8R46DRAFT_909706 [Mycena filopes]|nr:hypothetical protein C8R46DRAFT_909706 [Mycena filopes]